MVVVGGPGGHDALAALPNRPSRSYLPRMMSPPRTLVRIRRAAPEDAAMLASLAASSFADTFAADNDPRDMAEYMAGAFGESVQRAELEDPRNTVLLAHRGDEVVGYAMLREGGAPSCVADRVAGEPIELARLYAASAAIGSGVGGALMQACLDEAAVRDRAATWLGVWEHNARAIAFYRRWAFHDVGSQHFQLGRDTQTDRVMLRTMKARH
jgi:ribosomal protein S18 acetylase RimI-like enzyme